jgi:hypothetical protein
MSFNPAPATTLSIGEINSLVAAQVSVLQDKIAQTAAISMPFLNAMEGGTLDVNGQGHEWRTLVQDRAVLNDSLVAPTFTDSRQTCGTLPDPDEVGATEFVTLLERHVGRGPTVCLRQARHSVLNSYNAAATALAREISLKKNNDVRNQLVLRSGIKYVADSTNSFYNNLTGDMNVVGTQFNGNLPNAPVSFKTLKRLAIAMKEDLSVEQFGAGTSAYFLVIMGAEAVEQIRNEATVENAVFAQTSGGYTEGLDAITGYSFTDIQHRGLRMGIDQEPIRFNVVDANGFPVPIEPTIRVSSSYGFKARKNPAWLEAKYEVGFMIGQNHFRYLTPKAYIGEGSNWRFAPQMVAGELEWMNIRDNSANVFGDNGFHIYQIERAIEAIQPHAVLPFIYQRCPLDQGLELCETLESESDID